MKKVSCADRLQQLRENFGISEDAYDGDEVTSLSGEKPTLFLGDVKEVKHVRKALKRQRTESDRRAVYKFLYEYCTDELRQIIMNMHTQYDDLVEFCLEKISDMKKFWSNRPTEPMSVEDAFAEEDVEYVQQSNWEYEIPEYLMKQFDDYCKKHPIKGTLTLIARRANFLFKVDKIKKRTKKADKSIRSLDVDTVRKNLKKVVEDHKVQAAEFTEMVESLTGNTPFSQDLIASFNAHTDRVKASVKQKLAHLEEYETSVVFY